MFDEIMEATARLECRTDLRDIIDSAIRDIVETWDRREAVVIEAEINNQTWNIKDQNVFNGLFGNDRK